MLWSSYPTAAISVRICHVYSFSLATYFFRIVWLFDLHKAFQTNYHRTFTWTFNLTNLSWICNANYAVLFLILVLCVTEMLVRYNALIVYAFGKMRDEATRAKDVDPPPPPPHTHTHTHFQKASFRTVNTKFFIDDKLTSYITTRCNYLFMTWHQISYASQRFSGYFRCYT